MPTADDNLHTTTEVAQAIGRSKRTVHGWAVNHPERLAAAGWRLAVKLDGGPWLYRPITPEEAPA